MRWLRKIRKLLIKRKMTWLRRGKSRRIKDSLEPKEEVKRTRQS
jgi:hypothetical protein